MAAGEFPRVHGIAERSPAAPLRYLQQVLCAAVALVAPGSCRLCGGRLLQAVDYPICESCLVHLRGLPLGSTCSVCSEPLAPEALHSSGMHGTVGTQCSACLADPPRFQRAAAFGLYEDLRPAIRLLKFEGVSSLAKPLGLMLADAMLRLHASAPASMAVVPVPLFRGKRPYNQSTLLAETALRTVKKPARDWTLELRPDLLHRTRRTESQFLLSPAQRVDNLKDAFRASTAVKGLDILLIDDVYTTGATARECTRALLAAGAQSVWVATLARAGRDTAVRWSPRSASRTATTNLQGSSAMFFP